MSYLIQSEAEAKYPVHSAQGSDHKAWAKRIIYRLERGDNTLIPVQIQFAKEALGIEEKAAA